MAGEFRAGQAISRTFRVLRRQGIAYSLLCIATSMPARVLTYYAAPHTARFAMVHVAGRDFSYSPQHLRLLPVYLCSCALVPLGSAVIQLATMQELEGERPVLGAVFRRAAARYLPLVGCTVCGGLAVAGGCLLFIVPGVIVGLALSVSGQVCVTEALGPIASLSRSAALTRGNRWRILGFYGFVAAIFLAIGTVQGLAVSSFGMVGLLVGYFLSGYAEAFRVTACAVQYADLRLCREGVGAERIAAVFD